MTAWACSAAVALLLVVARRLTRRTPPPVRPTWSELGAAAILLAVGAYLRVYDVRALHDGLLTHDEMYLSRVYVARVLDHAPVLNGGSYLTHAILLDAWYRLVGFRPMAPRWLGVVLGFIGLGCWGALVRRLTDARTALWSTVVLGTMAYAVYFAKFALEPIHVCWLLPLAGLLLTGWAARPGWRRAVGTGFVLGATCFTYGGLLLGLLALAVGTAIAAVTTRPRPALTWVWPTGLGLVAVAALVVASGVTLHRRVFSQHTLLFLGGGALGVSRADWIAAVRVYLTDVAVATRSWNLPFRGIPFFEPALWPLALLGAVQLWRVPGTAILRGAVLSAPIVLLLLPLTGLNPGMRRGIYLLLPFALMAGAGLAAALGRLRGAWAVLLLLLAFGPSLAYQLRVGSREEQHSNFAHDFGARPLPLDWLADRLRTSDVALWGDEYVHDWDRDGHLAFRALAVRYGLLPADAHRLSVLPPSAPVVPPTTVVATWRPEQAAHAIMQQTGLCLAGDSLDWHLDAPAALHFVPRERATADERCPSAAPLVRACLELGASHRAERFAHDFTCRRADCDRSSLDSIFVGPGSIGFHLGRPDAFDGRPLGLALWVLYSQVEERANAVTVNGHALAPLDASRLRDAVAILPVPPAVAAADLWEITVGPASPPRMGWDLYRAAIVPLDRVARLPRDHCPIVE